MSAASALPLPEPQPSAAAQATQESIEEHRKAAKQSNDPLLQFEFAKFLIEVAATAPDSVPDDPKASRKYKEGLLSEGLKWIKRLASQGIGLGRTAYPEAQFFLANCYGNGSLGLPVDHDKAFTLYVQASKQSHASATYRTAVCYELGAGTKRDHARAVQFYRKAAALGDTAAMYKFGMVCVFERPGGLARPRPLPLRPPPR
ncbi:MAG: hypothetical protein BJ554DRAFT_4141 [Olpidium bornovanus]|uniref:HCP-like protein n=1 Tax=Olpidium bornovanus TaxID=278681 RepID=A0A8H7ZNF4_9FUNG|nr:MAG: hypothetical protein BJ554DRAFT_4141 [Olpidium bornovanus]